MPNISIRYPLDAVSQSSVSVIRVIPKRATADPPQSFAIATKAIILGIAAQACLYGIEVDISCNGHKSIAAIFNSYTLESFGPERTDSAVTFIEPNGETQLEFLHEGRDITHARH